MHGIVVAFELFSELRILDAEHGLATEGCRYFVAGINDMFRVKAQMLGGDLAGYCLWTL